jgi:outer membrane protein TolC
LDQEAVKLDVMETAALRYLRYLQARALVKTERDNLRLTLSNLELARVRREVGISGPEEVYRWESAQAEARARVLAARSEEEQQRVALNQSLGVDQRMRWKPEDIILTGEEGDLLYDRIAAVVDDATKLEAFRQFSVQYAFDNEPSLLSADKSIEAQKINVGQFKRRFYIPKFGTGFQFDHEVIARRPGETAAAFPGTTGAFDDVDTDDNTWVWNITASIPLFEGGGRFHDVAKAKADLRQVEDTRIRLEQLTDQAVRSAIYAIESSHPNIRLTRQSADSAARNLEVVQDKYKRGTVPIIDLLDAQNQAFVTEQAAIIAVYTHLQDMMRYQRSIAWFEGTKTDKQKKEWLAQMKAYLKQNTGGLPAPKVKVK